ncbi:MerR family transcriptional regulator [Streptomyces flavofungini]|uniref:MerR family transcriptional regulator n=1 Tax=Streptomyces flavofungini TaxID=68200 RepID=UPI0025AF9E50|nr:MerR family transcriptional regulator [Streptomyces flavofungini]WJV44123.1 MerR family transcriptional regulator [Streptomyces flavofungini]
MTEKQPPHVEGDRQVGLTTGAVARRFGVSPTTLRSWDRRYGIGPASREGGRHRRWRQQDIAVLDRMCRLTGEGVPPSEAAKAALSGSAGPGSAPKPVPASTRSDSTGSPTDSTGSPDGPTGASSQSRQRGLSRAALRLDSQAVDEGLSRSIADLGLVAAWETVIMPTLHAVGRKWQTSGERFVEVEHLLSWHVSTALRRVVVERNGRPVGAPVLLACTPGEGHSLPIEALAAALCERGLPVRMFGAALPAEALDNAVRRLGPAAVVLWAQSLSTASRPLAEHLKRTEWGVRGARAHPAVLLAGPGWAACPHIPETIRPLGLGDAVTILVSLLNADSVGRHGRRPAGSAT